MADRFESPPSPEEKIATSHHEDLKSDAHQAAERGHAATDMFVLPGCSFGTMANLL